MNLLTLFFYVFYSLPFTVGYLSSYQWTLINNIIKNPSSSEDIKYHTKKIIFKNYYKWSIKQYYIFIDKNYHLTKKLNKDELKLYAIRGLYKSLKNYNGNNTQFINYSNKYIDGELLLGVSELSRIKLIPHRLIVNKKWRNDNNKLYKNLMKGVLNIGHDTWLVEKYAKSSDKTTDIDIDEIKILVEKLEPRLKRIFYYKYNNNFTIDKISELMCLSNEYIRLSLNKINIFLKENFVEKIDL